MHVHAILTNISSQRSYYVPWQYRRPVRVLLQQLKGFSGRSDWLEGGARDSRYNYTDLPRQVQPGRRIMPIKLGIMIGLGDRSDLEVPSVWLSG